MKKTVRIIIAIFMTVLCIIPSFAEEYNVLVMPENYVRETEKTYVKSVDIEELFVRKLISKLEAEGIAYAPTTTVLKISIKNNPKYIKNATNSLYNIDAISKSYGVPKVVVVRTTTEMCTNNQQKSFWNRLDLPVLIPFETGIKLVTKVTMYNTKENEIIWSDVYYKKINYRESGLEIDDINHYYDILAGKVCENLKDCKETHAIMVKNMSDILNIGTKSGKKNIWQQFFENIKSVITNKKTDRQEILTGPVLQQNNVNIIEEHSYKKQPIKTPAPNLEMKVNKNTQENQEKTETKKTSPIQYKFYIIKQDLFKNIMKEFKNSENSANSNRQKTAKKVLKDKQNQQKNLTQQQKIREKKSNSAKKTSITDFFKSGYKRLNNNKTSEMSSTSESNTKISKYEYVIEPECEDSVSANKYIQSRPRYNSKNFIPKYDSNINDI